MPTRYPSRVKNTHTVVRMDATAWDRRYADTDLLWSAGPNRFVEAELAGLPPGRALDLAAGEGRNAVWLAGQGWTVTAVDFSAVAIDRGRTVAERAGLPVTWIVADLLAYRPDPGAFDAVLIAYLHLPPDETARVLDTAVRAVAPGGLVLIVGHDRTNLTEGVGGPQDPERLYTPELLTELLGELTIERAERVRRPVQTDAGPADAIDTLVRARRPG
jgi:SAM-dependent methyltransferase